MANLAEVLWHNAITIGEMYQSQLTIASNAYQLLLPMAHQLEQRNLATIKQWPHSTHLDTEVEQYGNIIIDIPYNQPAISFLYYWPMLDTLMKQQLQANPAAPIDINLILLTYPVSRVKDLTADADKALAKYQEWCKLTNDYVAQVNALPHQSNHAFIHKCWDHSLHKEEFEKEPLI